MIQSFNVFGEHNIPDVSICYPNRTKIGDLGIITNFLVDIKFNTYSEVTIEVPHEVNGVSTPYYDKLVQKNKLYIENYGYFIIQDVKETGDGIEKKKTIPAYSEECSLNYRSMNFLEGTYKFYDSNPATETIMSIIMARIPNWTLDYVTSSLWDKYRTFDNTNSTLYSLMMTTISKAYECFFIFDTEARTISVYSASEIVNQVAIYLSYDNVIKNIDMTSKSDEYVTALSVTGGGDLDIHTVNPLGTDFIYDFSYPIAQGQMSAGLAAAIAVWDAKIVSNQATYATTLTEYKTANSDLIDYQADLVDLQSQITVIDLQMEVRIEQGLTDLSDLAAAIALLEADISDVQDNIVATQAVIDAKYAILVGINADLTIENNFTTSQYNELLDYIIESSYQNENIVKTSIMTDVEVQEQAQELYDQGINVLDKISQPRFEFTIDSANFVFLREYLSVTTLLTIGSVITIELDETTNATPVLLEIKFNFYQPNEFSLVFGNRYRLDDSAYEFAELIQDTINRGSNIAVDTPLWKDWSTNHQQTVSDFVAGALDASKNKIVNSTNQTVTIDESGLRGRRTLEGGGFADEQVWIVNNTIAFTDDGWNTVRTALGQIILPDLSTTYGLVADAIVAGTLYANLVKILGTTNFYWDSDNIVIENPSDANRQIRIGLYDGVNYGIGFTTDGGDTWQSAINFDGVQIASGLQTDYISILNDEISIISGGKITIQSGAELNISAGGSVNFITNNFLVQDADENDMLRIEVTESDTGLILGSTDREIEFGGNFILGTENGGWGRTTLPFYWGSAVPTSGIGQNGDVYILYNASTTESWSDTTLSDPVSTPGMQTYFNVYRNWNVVYTTNDIWRIGNGVGGASYDRGTYFSFTAPAAVTSLTFTFYTSKKVPGTTLSSGLHSYVVALGSSLAGAPIATSTCQATTVPQDPSQQTVVLTSGSALTEGNTYYIGIYYADTTEGNSAAIYSTATYPFVLVGSTTSGASFGIYVKSNGSWNSM
jgi:hypothetical protein